MSARQKLNVAFLNGSLLLAAVAGIASGSGLVFVIALINLLACNLLLDQIRFRKEINEFRGDVLIAVGS